MNNIWAINNIQKFMEIRKTSENNDIMMYVVKEDSDKYLVVEMRKLLKKIASKLPHVTCLFFTISDNDIGKINFFPSDEDSYPYIVHIDKKLNKIMLDNDSIESIEDVIDTFNQIKPYYIKIYEEFNEKQLLNQQEEYEKYQKEINKMDNFNNDAQEFLTSFLADIKRRKELEKK